MCVCVCVIKDDVNDEQELYTYLYNILVKSRYGDIYMGGHLWFILQFPHYCNIYIYTHIFIYI